MRVLLALLLAASPLAAESVIRIPRVTASAPQQEGPDGLRIDDFRQRDPGDGIPVSEETLAYLSYDNDQLNVLFVCRARKTPVRAHRVKREAILSDDHVTVLLDTFHDRRRAYAFYVNPLGIQADSILAEGQEEDFSFDALWSSEGRLTDDGYEVRLSIPFKSLRFNGGGPQRWGIALGRAIVGASENSWWPHLTRRVEGTLQQLATTEGIEHVSSGRHIQLIPYTLAADGRFLERSNPAAASWQDAGELRAGADFKWVLDNSLTLDVALNPDFSQVESDQPQVTVNQRFEVFFPEKRPFFLENADLFQTPINLLFTRRIADPSFGARVTGRLGRWAFGALVADDRSPRSHDAAAARAWFSAVRVSRDVLGRSRLGALWTERNAGADVNRIGSLDARLTFGRNWAADLQAAFSATEGTGGERRSGSAWDAHLARSGRGFNYRLDYVDRSRDFVAASGFDPRADLRHLSNWAGYRKRPETGLLLAWGPDFKIDRLWDQDGTLLESTWGPAFHWELKRQTRFGLYHLRTRERFRPADFAALTAPRELSYRRNGLMFSTSFIPELTVEANLEKGTGVDFVTATDGAPRLASSLNGSFRLILRPTTALVVDNSLLISRLGDPEGGGRRLLNRILRSRWNYQISRRLSLRLILESEALLPASTAGSLQPSRRLTGDFLATYLINPWTAIHAGYTDRLENADLDAGISPQVFRLRTTRGLSTSVERRFFVKVSYLFNF